MFEKKAYKERLEEEIQSNERKTPRFEMTMGTISFDDAWRRELEYRERIRVRSLHSSLASNLPPHPQGLPAKDNIDGRKRKASFPPILVKQEASPSASTLQQKPPHSQYKRPAIQYPAYQALRRSPQPRQLPELQPLRWLPKEQPEPQPELSQAITVGLRCDLCDVPCTSDFNYKQHCEGKKHKAKWEEAFGNREQIELKKPKMLWCNECGIVCWNELSLAQHRVGKKHVLRLFKLQAAKKC